MGLKPRLSAEQMAWWQTGTQSLLSRAWVVDCWYVIAYKPHLAYYRVGDAIRYCAFTGSLYLMALGMPRWLRAITRLAARCLLLHGFGLRSVLLSTLHQFNPFNPIQ